MLRNNGTDGCACDSKQWPSHISGGLRTLLVLKSSNSRIISTWWHNNREFAQKDAQSIHWECLSIHPGYSSSQKAYVNLIWRTRCESDIHHISSRGKILIIYQTLLSIQSWPDHCLSTLSTEELRVERKFLEFGCHMTGNSVSSGHGHNLNS